MHCYDDSLERLPRSHRLPRSRRKYRDPWRNTIKERSAEPLGKSKLLDVQLYRKTTVESASFAEIHGVQLFQQKGDGVSARLAKVQLFQQKGDGVSARLARCISRAWMEEAWASFAKIQDEAWDELITVYGPTYS